MRKYLFITGLFSVLILAGCTADRFGNTVSDNKTDSKISASVSVSPKAHDFGTIVQSKGPVSTTFSVKNSGQEPLTINRLSTSCGCTTAKMDESPIQPNESREMTVTFDPMIHPDQFGKIERVVYLQTSDPENPEIEIDIIGNVTK